MTGETPDEDGLNSADGTGDGDPRRVPDPPSYRGKSCKGCLYYSSRLKSDGHNPVCVGIGRTLPQVVGVNNFMPWPRGRRGSFWVQMEGISRGVPWGSRGCRPAGGFDREEGTSFPPGKGLPARKSGDTPRLRPCTRVGSEARHDPSDDQVSDVEKSSF
ncbi:hypothetical protein C4D60_Mb04t27040 [Musa balbisiana]|uniref:DUF8204 domain-containing protein n=1 Tax=Musa balbisiana TaxID=52838 RepID=A0A4S8KEY5_MUSBA|nr:hypothetical protein C4D60_Mb04t27040 [Musa balbisiana]